MVTGLASLTSGEFGSGAQFPLKMGAALLNHHLGRPALLRLPAPNRPRRQRGRRGRLTGRRRQRGARTARATSQAPKIAMIGPMTAQSVTPDITLPPSTFSP
jgi:hypothetical protein